MIIGQIISALQTTDKTLLVTAIIIALLMWLFIDFRKSYINGVALSVAKIEDALDLYSKVFYGLQCSLDLSTIPAEIFTNVSQLIKYISAENANVILELNQSSPKSQRLKAIDIISNEMMKLKSSYPGLSQAQLDKSLRNGLRFILSGTILQSIAASIISVGIVFVAIIFSFYGIAFFLMILNKLISLLL